MKRTLKIVLVAATTLIGIGATTAQAAVSVTNGVGHVDKGDVQTALGWNNFDFDTKVGSVQFTADYTAVYENTLTCRSGQVTNVPVVGGIGSGPLTATQVKSSNGKQITGWNLTGAAGTVAATNDVNQLIAHFWTACDDGSIPVAFNMPSTPTVTFDGLKVNGIALPNTPVIVPVI